MCGCPFKNGYTSKWKHSHSLLKAKVWFPSRGQKKKVLENIRRVWLVEKRKIVANVINFFIDRLSQLSSGSRTFRINFPDERNVIKTSTVYSIWQLGENLLFIMLVVQYVPSDYMGCSEDVFLEHRGVCWFHSLFSSRLVSTGEYTTWIIFSRVSFLYNNNNDNKFH